MDKGVVYVAINDFHIYQAIKSAGSIKKWMPEIGITLFSNHSISDSIIDNNVIISTDNYIRGLKARYILQTPYSKTLFLDTDTYVCEDISHIFSLLDEYDMGYVHAKNRIPEYYNQFIDEWNETPSWFPFINSGVILFNRNEQVMKTLSDWESMHQIFYRKNPDVGDQLAFRHAIYHNHLKILTLIPEYNLKFYNKGYASGKVMILHTHYPMIEKLAHHINQITVSRNIHVELKHHLLIIEPLINIRQKKDFLIQPLIDLNLAGQLKMIFFQCYYLVRQYIGQFFWTE